MYKNLLFVCTAGVHRSVTARDMLDGQEVRRMQLWEKYELKYHAKSAGLSPTCENQVTQELINWADEVYCFEQRHRDKLRKKFKVKARCLHVPDVYDVGSEELKKTLVSKLSDLLFSLPQGELSCIN